MEPFVYDDMGMTPTASTNYGSTASQTQLTITSDGHEHPVGAGLATGATTTSTAAITHGWGKPASSATVVATIDGDNTKAAIFTYDTGQAMSTGDAPARRVGFHLYGGNASSLNATTADLFDAAARWAANSVVPAGYTPAQMNAVLVVGDPTAPNTRDAWAKERMEAAGWTVTYADDNGITSAAASGKQLVVIADSVAQAAVAGIFTSVAVPVVVMEPFVYDDMGLTPTPTSNYGNATNQTALDITAAGAAHALGAGRAQGSVTTSTGNMTHAWGIPAGTATIAATIAGDANKSAVFGYDTGAAMSAGTAPARRVGFYLGGGNASNITTTGAELFDNAIRWAADTIPVVTYQRDASDAIVSRSVNGITTGRYSNGPVDLTLGTGGAILHASIGLMGGVTYQWVPGSGVGKTWHYPNLQGTNVATAGDTGAKVGDTRSFDPDGNLAHGGLPDTRPGQFDDAWHGAARVPLEYQAGLQPVIQMGARQYHPGIGRFLEVDPIESGVDNDYNYPSDPINQADVDGTYCQYNPWKLPSTDRIGCGRWAAVSGGRQQSFVYESRYEAASWQPCIGWAQGVGGCTRIIGWRYYEVNLVITKGGRSIVVVAHARKAVHETCLSWGWKAVQGELGLCREWESPFERFHEIEVLWTLGRDNGSRVVK